MSGEPVAQAVPGRSAGAAIVALTIVALGGFVVFEAVTGPSNPGYAKVGPEAFPGAVGVALVLMGLMLLVQAMRGQWRVVWFEAPRLSSRPSEARAGIHLTAGADGELGPGSRAARSTGMTETTDRGSPLVSVLLAAAALILDVTLMPPLGFTVASAVMFTLVAAAFGSRRHPLNAALGLAFGGAIHLVFAYALGLHLPAGYVWGLLPWMS